MLLNYRMRFYLRLFFCVSLFFTSCKEKDNVPDNVLPQHEMAELLTDMHIVDGSLYNIPQSPDSLAKHGLGLYMGVFKVHHTDTATFSRSIKFYSTHLTMLTNIYTGIEGRLQKKIDSLQKHKPKVNTDSIAKANLLRKTDSLRRVKEKLKADSLQQVKLKKKKTPKKGKHKIPDALSK